MFDRILLEIFKFVGFICITGVLVYIAYEIWWTAFLKSKRGKLLTQFFLAHKKLYANWLIDKKEWGEIERLTKNKSSKEGEKI